MMCLECKMAGELLTDAITEFVADVNITDEQLLGSKYVIQDMHGNCTDPNTCTCQHRVLTKDEIKTREAFSLRKD